MDRLSDVISYFHNFEVDVRYSEDSSEYIVRLKVQELDSKFLALIPSFFEIFAQGSYLVLTFSISSI